MTTNDIGPNGAVRDPHDDWRTAAAAYAIDALDRDERDAFVAHMATCAVCRADVASFERVADGLAHATPAVAPPASLKSRTIDRALSSAPASGMARLRVSSGPARTTRVSVAGSWWLTAAAVVAALGLGIYAASLRSQIGSLESLVADSADHERALRAELDRERRDAEVRTVRIVNILTAPDLVRVDLAGSGAAATATGRAFWSRARGLVFDARGLPALDRGRVYQVWVLAPGPVGIGVLAPDAAGGLSMTTSLPAGTGAPSAVAVTNEPGPAGSAAPTTPILLAGAIRTSAPN